MMYEQLEIEGRKAGRVLGKVFVTDRKPQHFMRMYQGFGISDQVLQSLKASGVEQVHINYKGKTGDKKFVCPLKTFLYSRLQYIFQGNDLQLFVPIKEMTAVG